jgi:hypothetical protein
VSTSSPDDFVISFDAENQTVSADMALNASDGGGAKIRFGDAALGGSSTFTDDQNYSATAGKDSITVFLNDGVVTVLHSGDAKLQSGDGGLCVACDFIKWGSWESHLVFDDEGNGSSNVFAHGWWVAGDIIDSSDLPFDGSAIYEGGAIADVANNLNGQGWVTYTARGDMQMTWDFGTREGDLTISNFDKDNIDGGLTVTGRMTTPGEIEGKNKFSGELSGQNLPENLSDLSGSANGSFVRGPDNFKDGRAVSKSTPQGVIGNWNVGSERYQAGGIFAGSRATPR